MFHGKMKLLMYTQNKEIYMYMFKIIDLTLLSQKLLLHIYGSYMYIGQVRVSSPLGDWTARVGLIHSFVWPGQPSLKTTGLLNHFITLTNCDSWGSPPQVQNCGNLCPPYTLKNFQFINIREIWSILYINS